MEQDNLDLNSPNSDSTPDSEDPTQTASFLRSYFSRESHKSPLTAEDKEAFFYTWYNNGRPGAAKLHKLLAEKFPDTFLPTINTLDSYMIDYRARGMALDAEAHQQIEAAVIAEKVEMLKRHATTGQRIQDIALAYIEAHQEELEMPAAVRLLVEGVRIERESRGIPQALEKMAKMSDQDLLEEVKKLMTSAPLLPEDLDAPV